MVEIISAKDKQECLECLITCWDIVKWIADDFNGKSCIDYLYRGVFYRTY